jgi:hypothetical protein
MILWASQNKWLAKYRRSGYSRRGSMGRNKSCINVSLYESPEQIFGFAFAQYQRESGITAAEITEDAGEDIGA